MRLLALMGFAGRLLYRNLALEVLKLESTVRYLGIEVDDALEVSEQTEI
jgi:hypothetical protein